MATSVVYILYAGIVGRFGAALDFALVLVGIECVVFLGNGRKCPLTKLASVYGAKEVNFSDTFLPEKLTRYTAPTFGSLLAIGLLLLAFRVIQAH